MSALFSDRFSEYHFATSSKTVGKMVWINVGIDLFNTKTIWLLNKKQQISFLK